MQPISHIAWRRVPETLRQAILRQVSRSAIIGSIPNHLPIDDHLRVQLIDALQAHKYRGRRGDQSVTVRATGQTDALQWWYNLSAVERGTYISRLYNDVVQSR